MKNLILILTILLTLGVNAIAQNKFDASVVTVSDADSFTFRHSDGNLDKARLLGIDAPEVAHNSREIPQPYGDECKSFLQNLIGGQTVSIETSRRDGYGRNLARVLTEKGEDVNLLILEAGCAWSYYPNGIAKELRAGYINAFEMARATRLGLFANSRAATPKVWRQRKHLKRKPKA